MLLLAGFSGQPWKANAVRHLGKGDGYSSFIYKAQKLGTGVQHLTIKLTSISAGEEVNSFHSEKNVSHPRNWSKIFPAPSSCPCKKREFNRKRQSVARTPLSLWRWTLCIVQGLEHMYSQHNSALLLKASTTKGETAHLPLVLPA